MTTNFRMWAVCKVFLMALGLITVHRTISAAKVHRTAPDNFRHHVVNNKPEARTVGMQYSSSDAVAITDSNIISQHKRAANGNSGMMSNRRSLLRNPAPQPEVPVNPVTFFAPAPQPPPS